MQRGIKTLAFAIHSAAIDLGGISPDIGRAVIEKATGNVLWISSKLGDVLVAENLAGVQKQLCAADVEFAECRSIPPVKLTTGKLIRTFPHPDGYHYTPALMTDSEWREFCGLSQQWHGTVDSRELLASSFNGPG
jgi:hypothetical protein